MRPAEVRYFRYAVKAFALFGVLAAAALANAGRLVADPPTPCAGYADFALVPSGDPGARTAHALRLWRERRVGALVISGAGYGGDSAELLAARARRLEPEVPVVVEPEARSTEQNVARSCGLAGPRVAIVTDRAHAARVFLAATKLCPSWSACTAPTPEPVTFGMKLRETFRLLGYQLTGRASWATRP
ncbi:MAG: ElyC/SanA/YdcF family protein [Deltaproteobacteria bacterium]